MLGNILLNHVDRTTILVVIWNYMQVDSSPTIRIYDQCIALLNFERMQFYICKLAKLLGIMLTHVERDLNFLWHVI